MDQTKDFRENLVPIIEEINLDITKFINTLKNPINSKKVRFAEFQIAAF